MKILQASTQKPVQTLQEAVLALGRLVKFQKTSKQPLPGVKLPGQALVKLQHMAEAF